MREREREGQKKEDEKEVERERQWHPLRTTDTPAVATVS